MGVGLTIFRKANYAPDWPPPNSRKDSAILLPVACLLETELRSRAQEQTKRSQADIGFGSADAWPVERIFFIALAIAFITAHASIPFRYLEHRYSALENWTRIRGWFVVVYWPYMLIPPTLTSVWCWVRVYETRGWVKKSGWIGDPNPEFIIWDPVQMIAMGVLITVVMNMLTELMRRTKKDHDGANRGSFQRLRGAGSEDQGSDAYRMVNMAGNVGTVYQGYQQAPAQHW